MWVVAVGGRVSALSPLTSSVVVALVRKLNTHSVAQVETGDGTATWETKVGRGSIWSPNIGDSIAVSGAAHHRRPKP